MGFGYVNSPKLTVLIDYNTKEAAFKFLTTSRCLVVSLSNTSLFASKADELEMNAALLTFQHSPIDSSTFKKFKVIPTSDNINPNTHFNEQSSADKIHSDLIIESCEGVKVIATAIIQLINDNDDECTSLDQFHCILKNKICESVK
ncbi:uncharacterized protein [Watersipora subatra]|uniref:uncharacterized protein n=1 Tax=Watersipora subatra TaxID=2589382 RepID=UPI00355BFD06